VIGPVERSRKSGQYNNGDYQSSTFHSGFS
jgi:hypothetical protein